MEFIEKPYQVDDSKYSRFDQKYIGFARVAWDEAFKGFRKSISHFAPSKARKDAPGYTRVEYAMQAASWTLYDTYAGAFSKTRIGDCDAQDGPLARTADPVLTELGPMRVEDPGAMTSAVKRAAQVFGAADSGVAVIDDRWIYSRRVDGSEVILPEGVRYAVVMLMEMDLPGLEASPAVAGGISTGNGYSRMALASACLSEFIRNLGYTAIACGNDTALSVPLAIDAGLGEFGRNGLLIHPVLGQRVRICKVLTDLPLKPGKPVSFGAKRFCMTCKKCARQCPSKSISFDREPSWQSPHGTPSNNGAVLKWYVNADSCYAFWAANSVDCSNCIRSCPYTKERGWIHAVPRFFIRHAPFANRLWLLADDVFGYGAQRPQGKFMKSEVYLGRKSP